MRARKPLAPLLTTAELGAIERHARRRKSGYGISETNERMERLERDLLRVIAALRQRGMLVQEELL